MGKGNVKSPKCEVTGEEHSCNRKGVTKIKDIVCKHLIDNKPFLVCAKHKKEFLKCDKGEKPHYKEIKQNNH